MNFLIDNAISPKVSEGLNKLGHNSIHVRDIGFQHANDQEIFEKALEEDRVIISADTDFGFLLSKWNNNKPSVIIFRKGSERDPFKQIELLNANLKDELLISLKTGSIIIIETTRVRTRTLPIFKK
ncbi:MAG: DUF5615 family PIN-like protein [Bacteroidales bacterium]|nr:DUF5615 family PIN-like protein [Bacteroidales bacterium]